MTDDVLTLMFIFKLTLEFICSARCDIYVIASKASENLYPYYENTISAL